VVQANLREPKEKDHAKEDKDTVKDVYLSDEFSQCERAGKRKRRRFVDDKAEAVWKSCRDLAIDG